MLPTTNHKSVKWGSKDNCFSSFIQEAPVSSTAKYVQRPPIFLVGMIWRDTNCMSAPGRSTLSRGMYICTRMVQYCSTWLEKETVLEAFEAHSSFTLLEDSLTPLEDSRTPLEDILYQWYSIRDTCTCTVLQESSPPRACTVQVLSWTHQYCSNGTGPLHCVIASSRCHISWNTNSGMCSHEQLFCTSKDVW